MLKQMKKAFIDLIFVFLEFSVISFIVKENLIIMKIILEKDLIVLEKKEMMEIVFFMKLVMENTKGIMLMLIVIILF